MNMNENQTMMKNYILIVRTVHGEPDHSITVCLRGSEGQTEQIPLGKSQSYKKAFRNHQSDLFLLVSHIDIGEIYQVEFHVSAQVKFKEWKYNHILIIDGIRVYQDIISEYSLLPSTTTPSIVNVSESFAEPQQSIYYALIKTGHDSCSKEGYPKLSLFDNNRQNT